MSVVNTVTNDIEAAVRTLHRQVHVVEAQALHRLSS